MWSVVLKDGRHFAIGDGCYTIIETINELRLYGVITFDDEILSITQLIHK